jgi:propionyl-CoA carboxylase alpha chain
MPAEDARGFAELHVDGTTYRTKLTTRYLRRRPHVRGDPRRVRAVIPGTVRRLLVQPGEEVRQGQGLLVLEAMKMQNPVQAPADGRVARVLVRPGQVVPRGELLVELELGRAPGDADGA